MSKQKVGLLSSNIWNISFMERFRGFSANLSTAMLNHTNVLGLDYYKSPPRFVLPHSGFTICNGNAGENSCHLVILTNCYMYICVYLPKCYLYICVYLLKSRKQLERESIQEGWSIYWTLDSLATLTTVAMDKYESSHIIIWICRKAAKIKE